MNGENFTGTSEFKFVIYEAPSNEFRPASASLQIAPSGAIADITLLDGGAGYTSGVSVTIFPAAFNQGSGATASATVVTEPFTANISTSQPNLFIRVSLEKP